ncbi:MAG: NarK/NasA family nitrate transporter [Actinobacteria bacterium]|nr:NarK/NasA family nitrate transporter [Actinomycetota bacterium]
MNGRKAQANLALATIGFGLCFAVWSLISPLAPQFQKSLGLTNTETALLLALPVILGSLARIPMGILTDRFGGRKVFTALIVFSILPAIFMGFAHSYAMMLVGGFFLGMAGSSFAVGVPFVSRWYSPQSQGTALGIYGVGNIGTAVASYSVPWIASNYGTQYAFWVFAPVLAVYAALFWFLAEDASGAPKPGSLSQNLQLVKRERLSWIFSLFYFVTFGGFVAFSMFMPKLLVDWFAFNKTDAGLRTAGFVVLATLARPLGGYVADRIGGARLLALVFGIAPVLALVLAYEALAPQIGVVTVAMLLMAGLLGLGNGSVFKLVAQYFRRDTGVVTGIVGAAGGLGGFFPPMVMGAVRDLTGSYSIGLLLLAVFLVGCLAIDVVALVMRQPAVSTNERFSESNCTAA